MERHTFQKSCTHVNDSQHSALTLPMPHLFLNVPWMLFQCFVIGERLYYVAVQNLMHACRNVHLTPTDNIEAPVQQFSANLRNDHLASGKHIPTSLKDLFEQKEAHAAFRILSTDCTGLAMNHKITENWKCYQNIYYSLICTYSIQVKSHIVLHGVVLFHRCI